MNAIAELYEVSETHNSEIRLQFYEVALSDPESAAAKKYASTALKWVVGEDGGSLKGRMKFCRPTFVRAGKVDHELAVKTFKAHSSAFHPIARKLIEKVRFLGVAIRMTRLT